MSGYLHRIIHQLRTPAPSAIRPLVGSLYTPATPSDPFALHEEVVVAAAPHTTHGPQTTAPHPYGTHASSPTTRSMDDTRGRVESTGTRSTMQPLMPQSVPSEMASAPVSEFSADSAPLISPETSPMPEPVSVQMAHRAEQASAIPLSPQPLMPRQAAPIAIHTVPLVAPSTPVHDEVHINIGRIEVTAVPQAPAPPRPTPRPPRRNMSLDEYLRRSDGRAQ